MAAPKIAAVATATPPWRYDQATVLRMSGYDDPLRMGFFRHSLIEGRHLYMDPQTFTPNESVDQLSDRLRRGAIDLGRRRVRRVVERAGWDLADVDFLATTTCTGRLCPSLDAHIIAALGLKPSIQRVHVGDTGCASALVALQQAVNHVQVFPITARWWWRWRSAPPRTFSTTGWRARWLTPSSRTGREPSR